MTGTRPDKVTVCGGLQEATELSKRDTEDAVQTKLRRTVLDVGGGETVMF